MNRDEEGNGQVVGIIMMEGNKRKSFEWGWQRVWMCIEKIECGTERKEKIEAVPNETKRRKNGGMDGEQWVWTMRGDGYRVMSKVRVREGTERRKKKDKRRMVVGQC